MARASILWLLGEYCERVPKVAPDVLRKMAKSFGSEVNTSTTLIYFSQTPFLQHLNVVLSRRSGVLKESKGWSIIIAIFS